MIVKELGVLIIEMQSNDEIRNLVKIIRQIRRKLCLLEPCTNQLSIGLNSLL